VSSSYSHTLDSPNERSLFLTRTYGHLFGALVAFVALEAWLFESGAMQRIAEALFGVSWLLVLGAFILVAWGAAHLAHSLESKPMQYAGLGLYIVAEGLIFCPLIWRAERMSPGVSGVAAIVTLIGFSALTAIVFVSRRDFKFLGPFLWWGFVVALGLIVCSVLFGLRLGPLFSVAMIGFAGASILYDTSNVLHRYGPTQYVGASLELFGSFALLLWYVYRLLPWIGKD
jgi:FtsH-binding integral membrane protein